MIRIALLLAALFLAIPQLSLAADVPATRPAAPASQPTAAKFPTFGVSFELPGGWTEIPREKAGRVGQWIGPDSTPAAMKQLIMIETGRPGGTSIENMAKGLARNFGGIVMDDPTTLGAEPAMVVRAENHDDELAPVFGLICIHGDNVYLVMGGALKDRDVRQEIEVIRKSWKWTAVDKPAAHLAMRDKPFAAFNGSVLLNAPAMMHHVPADDPRTQLDLAMFNLVRNNADFRASMTLSKLREGETFESAKVRFLKELAEQYKFKDQPEWREPKPANPAPAAARAITATVEVPRPQPADTDTLHHQWAAVDLSNSGNRILLIHFTHESETEEERHAYEKAVDAIVQSVTLAK